MKRDPSKPLKVDLQECDLFHRKNLFESMCPGQSKRCRKNVKMRKGNKERGGSQGAKEEGKEQKERPRESEGGST